MSFSALGGKAGVESWPGISYPITEPQAEMHWSVAFGRRADNLISGQADDFKLCWLKMLYLCCQMWTNIPSKTYALNIFLNTETRPIRWLGDPAENRVETQRMVSGRGSLGCSVQSVSWTKQWREAAVDILRGPVVASWHATRCRGSQHGS